MIMIMRLLMIMKCETACVNAHEERQTDRRQTAYVCGWVGVCICTHMHVSVFDRKSVCVCVRQKACVCAQMHAFWVRAASMSGDKCVEK